MRALHRIGTIVAALAVSVTTSVRAGRAEEPPPSPPVLPPCRVVDASITTRLDSKSSRPGEVFHFTATPGDGQPSAEGVGIVNFVHGANRGGEPGQISIELRYIQQPDGTHVPAMIVPDTRSAPLFNGRTRNAPFIVGALGLAKGQGFHIAAGLAGAYDFLHSGGQAVIPAGTHLRVVLGDDYLAGRCTLVTG